MVFLSKLKSQVVEKVIIPDSEYHSKSYELEHFCDHNCSTPSSHKSSSHDRTKTKRIKTLTKNFLGEEEKKIFFRSKKTTRFVLVWVSLSNGEDECFGAGWSRRQASRGSRWSALD